VINIPMWCKILCKIETQPGSAVLLGGLTFLSLGSNSPEAFFFFLRCVNQLHKMNPYCRDRIGLMFVESLYVSLNR
jgi:hypothetical protein